VPLEDLLALGYEIEREPDSDTTYIRGHDRIFSSHDGITDEEALVQRATNHARLTEKMQQAQAYFAQNFADWPNMTAAQKDGANRQAQRALANLIRHVRNDLTTEGV
jgi:hypothetical protein